MCPEHFEVGNLGPSGPEKAVEVLLALEKKERQT